MLELTSLDARNSNIADLTGLEHATLCTGSLGNENQIHNLEPLAGLMRLESLALGGNQISDLSPLANLTNLTGMDLGWNNISDITPLANLTKLEWLNLIHNSIGDISPLANLTNLWLLHIQFNRIADITPCRDLTSPILYMMKCVILNHRCPQLENASKTRVSRLRSASGDILLT